MDEYAEGSFNKAKAGQIIKMSGPNDETMPIIRVMQTEKNNNFMKCLWCECQTVVVLSLIHI